jgi:hypothetical protein
MSPWSSGAGLGARHLVGDCRGGEGLAKELTPLRCKAVVALHDQPPFAAGHGMFSNEPIATFVALVGEGQGDQTKADPGPIPKFFRRQIRAIEEAWHGGEPRPRVCRVKYAPLCHRQLLLKDSGQASLNVLLLLLLRAKTTFQGGYAVGRGAKGGSGECFPNPNTHKKDGKKILPWLLEENPNLKDVMIYYLREHLHELLASLLYHYLHEEALPALVEKKKEELDNHE